MKVNEKALGWGVIIIIFAALALSYKFRWITYALYIFIVIFMSVFLWKDIISLKRNGSFDGKKLVVEVSYYGHLIWILYIFNIIMHIDKARTIELAMDIFVIFAAIIYIPINYKNNSKIIFYENGIYSPKNSIFLYRIIDYNEIEKIHFTEYLKGKFILQFKLEGKTIENADKYKINKMDKKEIISFISEFLGENKIIESKEYKEDQLW